MTDWGKRLVLKQDVVDRLLTEYEGMTVTPSVLQDISKRARLSYPAVKIRAKRHNITVKRAW